MKRESRQRGAAIVEFAILIVLLIIFLFSIFEFGFLWLNSHYIANSAREGARVAAKVTSSEDDRRTAAETAVNQYLAENRLFSDNLSDSGFMTTSYQDGSLTVTVDGDDITVPLSEVTVTVQTAMIWEPVLWPLLNALFGKNYELREITQSASFAIE